jgi:hypothetical protein
MINGAFYWGNLPFSKHQSADCPNFVLGIYKRQNVQKRSLLNKNGTNEVILTVNSAFYSENLPLSNTRSADCQNFVQGTQERQKREISSFCNEI